MRLKQFNPMPSLGLVFLLLFSGGLSRADAEESETAVLSNPGYHSVVAGRDEASLNEFYRLIFMAHKSTDPNYKQDMKKMMHDGRIIEIPNGTTVRVVRVGSWSTEVEILSGEFERRLLYVPGKFVVKSENGTK